MIIKRLFLFFLLCWVSLGAKEPRAVYLTWDADPSSTMTIQWMREKPSADLVQVQKVGDSTWVTWQVDTEKLEGANLWVYAAKVTGLEEDTVYLFRIGAKGETYKMRTLPSGLNRPLKVVIGGDAYLDRSLFDRMNREVASMDPDFVIMGGDIAYTEGLRRALKPRSWQAERWLEFCELWSQQMVAPDGRLIPIVPVLGNHDVREGFDNPMKDPVPLFQVFSFPEKGISYRVLSIGREVAFFLLDSGHAYPVAGAQTQWLERELRIWREALYKIPVYHIAAYPSVYSFDHGASTEMRKVWVPLFEKYGVRLVFENDNHAFKRTFPIRGGQIDERGVVYLGDGAWGVKPRKPKAVWYLAKASRTNCVWLLTITKEKCTCEAYNLMGQLIDRVEEFPTLSSQEAAAIPDWLAQ